MCAEELQNTLDQACFDRRIATAGCVRRLVHCQNHLWSPSLQATQSNIQAAEGSNDYGLSLTGRASQIFTVPIPLAEASRLRSG